MSDNDFVWRKARASGSQGGNCIEVGTKADSPAVLIRDTKSRERGHLTISREVFQRFIKDVAKSELPKQDRTPSVAETPRGFCCSRCRGALSVG